MPINYEDIEKDIVDIAAAFPEFQQELNSRREAARMRFAGQFDQQQLADKIRKALSISRNLRCAVPTAEPINQRFPLPANFDEQIIIAVDGSQINPSRHQAVDYFLLNIGVITYPARSDQTPTAERKSKLFSNNSRFWQGINPDQIAYLRDLEERRVISDKARIYGPDAGVITLTDGPLELWLRSGDGTQNQQDIEKALEKYRRSLIELSDLGALTAGYVDKPRARLVVETLEIDQLGPGELDRIKEMQPNFEGVTDSDLFAGVLTKPGDRSAVFKLQFALANQYHAEEADLALHFFYLNVSQKPGSPVLSRVEIPGWVAADPERLALVQATLYHQCNLLGDVRYPYVLHRAHEEAVVTNEDREELERLIIREFARKGIPIGVISNKQTAKNLATGKRRHSLGSRKY